MTYMTPAEYRAFLMRVGRLASCPVLVEKRPCKVPGDTERDGYCHMHDPLGQHQMALKAKRYGRTKRTKVSLT